MMFELLASVCTVPMYIIVLLIVGCLAMYALIAFICFLLTIFTNR